MDMAHTLTLAMPNLNASISAKDQARRGRKAIRDPRCTRITVRGTGDVDDDDDDVLTAVAFAGEETTSDLFFADLVADGFAGDLGGGFGVVGVVMVKCSFR